MSGASRCPMCDGTFYLDHCGFCMDVCPCAGFAAESAAADAEAISEDQQGETGGPESALQ
ncbi:hypothetical protein [Novosphingobium sp. KACC 22771]|uniref:hypothetical protein n=1 Tax=Novosphingobium sp. KACC 22771 TaxID=3025670 RepID=UPI0023672455|nr:hypothetical protein [Novosphingobium sp. KACC 22771]WDF73513.1 hypothetical protein PQ467_05560 [Novosphingobium sp. KACC 22771]